MKKQFKNKTDNELNDNFLPNRVRNKNDEWEKRQDRYYMNLLNDIKATNIDNEEILDHLDDFNYPAY
jgi:hypothetical protein